MNRIAKMRKSTVNPEFDSYIPSGSPRGHSRPATEAPNPLYPENPAVQDFQRTSRNPENPPTPPDPNTPAEAQTPKAAASPDPSTPPSPENPPAPNSNPQPEPVKAKPAPKTSSSVLTSNLQPLLSVSHHGRRCTICSHPLRDAIEADFLRWRSPDEITREFRIGSRTSIYRHANATGLFRRRKEQFGRVLEFFLEQAETCCLEDANVVIRAARIYAHLDHNGKWVESPRTNYVYHGPAPVSLANAAGLDPSIPVVPPPARLQQPAGDKARSPRLSGRRDEQKAKGEEKANRYTRKLKNG